MSNVIELGGYTKLDIEPDKVLNGALGKLDQVLVLGVAKDGEFYTASSSGKLERATFMAAKFIHKVHAGDYY